MNFTESNGVLRWNLYLPTSNLVEYGYCPVEELYGLEVNAKQLAAAIEYVQNWRGVTVVVLPVERTLTCWTN